MTILLNPKNLDCDFEVLSEKLTIANTLLAQSPKKGGLPFVYAFCSAKQHILDDKRTTIPHILVKEKKIVFSKTACTDGKAIYWHPKFLKRVSPFELSLIISHEVFHMVLQHCSLIRTSNLDPKIWNIAVDYASNAVIEQELLEAGFISKYGNYKDKHPLWGGNLCKNMTLAELIDSIKEANKQSATQKPPEEEEKLDLSEFTEDHEWEPDLSEMRMYADVSQYGRSPEEIYEQIVSEIQKNKKDEEGDGGGGGGGCGYAGIPQFGGFDAHEPHEVDKQKLLADVLNAALSAKRLAGSAPAAIEDLIGKLQEPKMKWQDICNSTFNKKRVDYGKLNNWSRIRRRSVSTGVYMPKFCDYKVRWLAALDTSGSMSNEDMAFGLSQLKSLDPRCEGTLVCWDADVYWDRAVPIRNVNELSNSKVYGRGGTTCRTFFEDYKKKLSKFGPFDLIIMITDGYLYELDLIKPECDVIWVITSDHKDFKPPFGKVAHLRSY